MRIAQDRRALVTGGGAGFGRRIARRLHEAGAMVAVLDIDGERVKETVADLGARSLGIAADVRSAAEMRAAVARTVGDFGGLDTLVVSAGVFHVGTLEETDEDDWDRTLDVNLKGAFMTVKAAAAALRESGRGRIVTIGSDCGRRGFPGQAPYVASKFGLIGLTESVAAELAPAGVTANCVCPVGCPTTEMGRQVLDWKTGRTGLSVERIMEATAATNPLGRNATEDDVADAALFFLSDQAGFLTGVTLDVDGGARLGAIPGTL
ncbi:3-oxoacyl-[acyl-carrier protein] reductase [Thermomonospora echinospora]|uniref:3-oxoacyl-[acyl-carrier protein] reductase n=1 Tax=Thermomonospora echinospora TaxID=1992 RepID=A0A1H6CZR0_9ACTN|nr:SDR family NAD(P)-dependent oxidoreductase [Thermomonospora echinospora]SEG78669.1 3-oxoacyl-[acyl-carrier protein] reductase [Thermomonospora echinospora]